MVQYRRGDREAELSRPNWPRPLDGTENIVQLWHVCAGGVRTTRLYLIVPNPTEIDSDGRWRQVLRVEKGYKTTQVSLTQG